MSPRAAWRLEATGFGPVLVVNEAGVVMGAAYREGLAAAPGEAGVGTVMRVRLVHAVCP